MTASILLTTFDIWLPHHVTNSSDDLILEVLQREPLADCHLIRKLEVDFDLAPQKTIACIQTLRPKLIVCCGMAEKRSRLSVESGASWNGQRLNTVLSLDQLIAGLAHTEISHDAGVFVCNRLYYEILHSLKTADLGHNRCIFVHVPILVPENRGAIVQDFLTLLDRLRGLIL